MLVSVILIVFNTCIVRMMFIFQLLLNPLTENKIAKDDTKIIRYSSKLHLYELKDGDSGVYQCVILNSFGPAYSMKASIEVHGSFCLINYFLIFLRLFNLFQYLMNCANFVVLNVQLCNYSNYVFQMKKNQK